ncbi:hypothetical protein B7494_g914 [Chlorociboria aeruginascens]|nr:hypothetical protein B7494_g914 [Chlorociboria aeruginascens]
MNSNPGLRFLRPYLCKGFAASRRSAHLNFHTTTTLKNKKRDREIRKSFVRPVAAAALGAPTVEENGNQIDRRVRELKDGGALVFPRMPKEFSVTSCNDFLKQFEYMRPGERHDDRILTLRGRVHSSRLASTSLAFFDIVQDGIPVQVVCDFSKLGLSGAQKSDFRKFCRMVRRGDIISVSGGPYRTHRGELSISATDIPIILTPNLSPIPVRLEHRETRIRNRHVDLLVNPQVADTMRARFHIIQYIREFLLKDDFLEVQTPIVSEGASGAIARPFTTTSTELLGKELSLRVSPEIWLKRLVIGGLDRVFEIGPAFRNEGLDATHNPEFTTCEFYKSFADLEELISMTEAMVYGLAEHIVALRSLRLNSLPQLDPNFFKAPFKRIDFVPALESALGESLPDLATQDAEEQIKTLFLKYSIPLPVSPTLPRLLDKLSSVYIEPQCNQPTFIMHHPACLAPLSKSFLDPTTNQVLSARAELFIQHREIANMYEEENSPFEQRAKFIQQSQWKDEENSGTVDESYVKALTYGLPPTGGWGCGIDRLCMFFTNAVRISDVLPFGSLRNVVSVGQAKIISADKTVDRELQVGVETWAYHHPTMPRVFFITGTSTGFGSHLVQEVIHRGDIAVATARKPEALKFKGTNDKNYLPLKLDVTSSADIASSFKSAVDKFGRIDVVVNNAGYGLAGVFEELTDQQIKTQMDVNFFGLMAVTKKAMETMREQKPSGGVIQNVTSIGGQRGVPTFSIYCASKWAVEGFTESISKEVKPEWGIKFTCIEPGGFRTDWAGRSMEFPEKRHPAYDHLDAKKAMGKRHGTQVGDPIKGSKAMYELAIMDDPPLRIVLGSDAYNAINEKIKLYSENYKKYEDISTSTDVDESEK